MAKRKTKTNFIGIKVTAEQVALLSRLQKTLDLHTKTEVILRALSLADRLYSAGSSASLEVPSGLGNNLPDIVSRSELAKFEAEARQYVNTVEQAKNKSREVIREVTQELSKTDEILTRYQGDGSALIQALLELQRENRWLSEDTLKWVSRKLGVPLTQIYHVATFYKAFSLVPRGRHSVSVCLGTACQVRGAPRLLDKVMDTLGIRAGETSRDMQFSLDTVNCLGCCALGPVMVVDGEYHSNPSTEELKKIIAACA